MSDVRYNVVTMVDAEDSIKPCGFCKPEVKETQEIIRTQYSRLIYPLAPTIFENVMVIPIRHVSMIEDLTPEEIVDIFEVVKKVHAYFCKFHNTTAYNLFINNGPSSGQHEQHVHFHFFGRSEDEEISPYKKLKSPDKYPVQALSVDELKRRVHLISTRLG
ncbi:HIT family protein [bacterium]|uniref:HIT domain-containing protein n=2 Tax=Katanobacteria TaxID=422282 RepID=A0A2M7X1H2_UNCKA|nr:HIT family protein [bacterium]PIP56480.1 MAG: hypothetical protein COX05_02820 [candidate division WWE3 bacterium CG22_combo_CG10-13_8_21_14_all_39_12]PJA40024.1 MAG: hypothetical protein CO179_03625 [candidate division WWE3 bacterium CG_4_9_14_3_um_filter_39_7]